MDRQQRAADVAGALGTQHRQQLVLRTVGIPQREILVVGPAVGTVDLLVVTAIAAVGVAAGQRLQQRVVQRGVEHRAVVLVAALHADAGQFLAPGVLGLLAHLLEAEQLAAAHAVAAQVVARAFGIDVGDRADRGDRLALARVEAQPGAVELGLAFHAVTRARQAAGLAPGAERLERTIELDAEPGGVLVATAEAAGDQLAFHHAIAHHVDGAADHRMALVGLRHVDQHVAFVGASGEGVALGRRAGQRGRLGVDAAVIEQAHLVIARLPHFTVVAVAGGVGLVVETLGILGVEVAARPDRAGDRQDRDLAALLPATGAGQERMAEAADLGIVVTPARVVLTDGADLDQAEWRRSAREGIAVVLAADEGVHFAHRIHRRCGVDHRRGQRQQRPGITNGRAWKPVLGTSVSCGLITLYACGLATAGWSFLESGRHPSGRSAAGLYDAYATGGAGKMARPKPGRQSRARPRGRGENLGITRS